MRRYTKYKNTKNNFSASLGSYFSLNVYFHGLLNIGKYLYKFAADNNLAAVNITTAQHSFGGVKLHAVYNFTQHFWLLEEMLLSVMFLCIQTMADDGSRR